MLDPTLRAAAERWGRAPAYVAVQGWSVSYADLDRLADEVAAGLADRGLVWRVAEGEDLDRFIGDADVLTDDHAPVDQLLTPYG